MIPKTATKRRWLRSVIAASAEPLPNMPWARGNRVLHAKPAASTPILAARQNSLSMARKSAIAAG